MQWLLQWCVLQLATGKCMWVSYENWMHIAGKCYGNGPWHDILHEWHIRIEQQLECNGFKIWSHRYLTEYWKFANYVALLPEDRWIRRVLAWHPRQGRIGRTFMTWHSPLQHFVRWQHFEDWIVTAQATDLWQHYFNDFFTFTLR